MQFNFQQRSSPISPHKSTRYIPDRTFAKTPLKLIRLIDESSLHSSITKTHRFQNSPAIKTPRKTHKTFHALSSYPRKKICASCAPALSTVATTELVRLIRDGEQASKQAHADSTRAREVVCRNCADPFSLSPRALVILHTTTSGRIDYSQL